VLKSQRKHAKAQAGVGNKSLSMKHHAERERERERRLIAVLGGEAATPQLVKHIVQPTNAIINSIIIISSSSSS